MSRQRIERKENTCLQPLDPNSFRTETNPFQSHFWGSVKKASGWKPLYFSYCPESEEMGMGSPFLVLEKNLFQIFPIYYIPFGPDGINIGQRESSPKLTALNPETVNTIGNALKKFVSPLCIFIRFDLPWGVEFLHEGNALRKGKTREYSKDIRICPYSIQPEATYHIDLQQPLNRVYENFRSRCRRYIRKGVEQLQVTQWNGEKSAIDSWYELYCITAERDGFAPRSRQYVDTLISLGYNSQEDVKVTLFFAYKADEMVGGILVMYTSREAVYLLGASKTVKQLPSSSYLLHWKAINFLKDQGCRTYDLFGVPKKDSPDTHLAGLELFKSSFGGTYIEREKSIDIIGCRSLYRFYSMLEYIRITRARKNSD